MFIDEVLPEIFSKLLNAIRPTDGTTFVFSNSNMVVNQIQWGKLEIIQTDARLLQYQ